MAFLVMTRTHRPREGGGAGRWAALVPLCIRDHQTLGILRSRKSPYPSLDPLITYIKIF